MYNFDEVHKPKNEYYKNSSERNIELFQTDKIIPFWIADMDFKVSEAITDELNRIVTRGIYAYESVPDDYYDVISGWFNKRHGYQLNSTYFLAVPGILTGIAFLIEEFSKIGDSVLIQTPVYHQFKSTIKKTGRKAICNSLKIEEGRYEMDFDDLEEKFQKEEVKIMILCNPHNPVGRVWEKESIEKIVQLTQKYKVVLVSDEVHSEIIFKEHEFTSLTQYKGSNIISILGSSGKTFGLQSIASGIFYINDKSLREKLNARINALHLNHGNTFSRYATYAAYKNGAEWFDEMLVYVERNYLWIRNFIETKLPLVKIMPLEGTYLIWIDFNGLDLSKVDLEDLLFRKAGIGFASGEWFGEEGKGFMRMTIACPFSIIQEVFIKLKTEIDLL